MGLVRFGIISTAHINRLVIPGLQASDKAELIAVASREQSRAEKYAREWGIERAYGSYDALLEDPDIDAVYISLPNTMHCEWSIRAVEAGKHVLCEKPLSRHPAEVEQAFDAAEQAGYLLTEAFMYRHNPQTKKLVELVQEGAIGELRLVRSTFSYSLYDAENIRLRTDVEGGSLMDVGCYCVSGSRLVAGEPEDVLGRAYIGAERHRLGLRGKHAVSRRRRRPLRLRHVSSQPRRARGRRDRRFALPRRPVALPRSPVIELRTDGEVERIELDPVDSYQLEVENLCDAIRGEAPLLLGREDAVAQARALEALHRSAETRTNVTLR